MIYTLTSLEEFDKRIHAFGIKDDLRPLLSLDLNFFERYENYAVINLRSYSDQPNNLLVLSETDSLLYSGSEVNEDQLKLFKFTLKKKYGESTVLTLIVLKRVLETYSREFEKINAEIDKQEIVLNHHEIESISKRLRKLGNKVEDFVDMLIKLEERDVREVNTGYVSYDYDVLLAKSRHLLDRIKSHSSQIVGLRNEVEIRFSRELNSRLESLNHVIKQLTAITILPMIPNIIAGHYGMNIVFSGLVNVNSPNAELEVLGLSAGAMLATYLVFKWKKWL